MPLVQLYSTFFGSLKRGEIRRELEILCHCVLVLTELHGHHLMCLCKLYISCWGWVLQNWCLYDGIFKFHEGFLMFWSPFKFSLLSCEQGLWLCYPCKILDKLSIVAYQSEEGTDLLGGCLQVHLLYSLCL